MWQNPQLPVNFVIFNEETLNGKLHFLCTAYRNFTAIFGICLRKYMSSNTSQLKRSKYVEKSLIFTEEILRGKFHLLCGGIHWFHDKITIAWKVMSLGLSSVSLKNLFLKKVQKFTNNSEARFCKSCKIRVRVLLYQLKTNTSTTSTETGSLIWISS